jgi:N utilization substance protein B
VGARSKARKRALDVLYEAAQRRTDPVDTLRERLAQSDPPVTEYAVELVEGVAANRERIDELLYRDDIPDAVAVSEAVELAGSLSTDESPAFVNGLLARLQSLKPHLTG